ncbi:S49 family peptidase [Allokutzneria sp. A3M-2-11 16]|uniref:S49 family peptidase n=1 Tax=Allokutzneria sp. A3M-2-11 16 TaxID=2962043 RepID=UPI0020B8B2F2|nr:S49 family peptidase [Allokutzneria sp. A3M-2-11 16]MCP3799600.1 S49 family peptidase [Allokutzneria sp. A3M-2-11 16]
MSVTEKLAARLPILGNQAERAPVVAVVRLHGVITPNPSPVARGALNLQSLESALTKAFEHDRLAAVALLINSPGGSPTQSALIATRIRELADRKKVPVLAFCEDAAASGGYWLACAADEIYAHGTSMVGSIGVINSGFGLDKVIERFGVQRRLHTAGTNKSRLDPFSPEKPEDVEWVRGILDQLHVQFTDWVKQRRGDRLRGTDEELFNGEVWLGAKAAELGLTDGVGTLRQVVTKRWKGAEITVTEPKKPLLAKLGIGASALFGSPADKVLAAVEAVEHRVWWSRLGL